MAKESRPRVVSSSEIGESGVQIFNGIITGEEYLPELTGIRAYMIYDEMRRSNATVSAILKAMYLPIMAAEWYVEPASEDEADKKIAEEMEHNIKERINFQSFLQEALTMLPFGFSIFEEVLEAYQYEGAWRIGLKKMAFRKQTSIHAWEMTTSHKPGITQFTRDGKKYEIPREKLTIFTNQKEGENHEGISVLRSAYQHWYIIKTLYQIDSVGHERQALGVVKIHAPRNPDENDKKAAIAAARNTRANQEAFIYEPEGWAIDFMDMKAGSLRDILPSINHHDRQISKNVLAQFLEIGAAGGTGTRSTSEDHSRLFELSLQAIAQTIADGITEQLIKPLVDLNYTVTKYPRMAVGKIGDTDVPQVATALKTLVDAKILTPTDVDEEHVRKLAGLPEMPEEIRNKDRGVTVTEQPTDDDAPTTDPKNKEQAEKIEEDTKDVKAAQILAHAHETKKLIEGLYDIPEAA